MSEKNPSRKPDTSPAALLVHGAKHLTQVGVDAYNAEIRSNGGFVGDRVTKRAFLDILDGWRQRIARNGEDPLGEVPTDEIGKSRLDKLLAAGDAEAGGAIHSAIEEFSQELAAVIRRFLRLKEWKDTQRIVVGGGLRESRVGELAIGRTAAQLLASDCKIDVRPIRYAPDHAGLIGCIHLVPPWMLDGYDSILAVDIGGTNIRAGIVELHATRKQNLAKASVRRLEMWRHRDDLPKRDDAVTHLIDFLAGLIQRAQKDGLALAPLIGVGCPGLIQPDGAIARGGHNLPGNWESKGFNLPQRLHQSIPVIGEEPTVVVMHNDAVVQGLSELPWMTDVERWGVMTIGTGLGNAHFVNRPAAKD